MPCHLILIEFNFIIFRHPNFYDACYGKRECAVSVVVLNKQIYSIKIIYLCIFLSNTACIYYYYIKRVYCCEYGLRFCQKNNVWVQHRWKFPCVLSFPCQDTRFCPCFSRLKLTTQRVMFLISSCTTGGWKSSFSHWIISHYEKRMLEEFINIVAKREREREREREWESQRENGNI